MDRVEDFVARCSVDVLGMHHKYSLRRGFIGSTIDWVGIERVRV
jgi:hypothetical protein